MTFTSTQTQILQELRKGKDVGAYDKERQQRIHFDSQRNCFLHWIDEWGVGERTEILRDEEEALAAIKSIRSFAHPHDEDMWESILYTLNPKV